MFSYFGYRGPGKSYDSVSTKIPEKMEVYLADMKHGQDQDAIWDSKILLGEFSTKKVDRSQ